VVRRSAVAVAVVAALVAAPSAVPGGNPGPRRPLAAGGDRQRGRHVVRDLPQRRRPRNVVRDDVQRRKCDGDADVRLLRRRPRRRRQPQRARVGDSDDARPLAAVGAGEPHDARRRRAAAGRPGVGGRDGPRRRDGVRGRPRRLPRDGGDHLVAGHRGRRDAVAHVRGARARCRRQRRRERLDNDRGAGSDRAQRPDRPRRQRVLVAHARRPLVVAVNGQRPRRRVPRLPTATRSPRTTPSATTVRRARR